MVASSQARQAARRRPVVLTIAGSDNSAGAGAQADLKTFSYFGCYGLTAITCVVAEVPGKVAAIQAIRPAIVAKQIALSLAAFPVAAAKTGMLRSAAIVEAVAEALGVRTTKLVVDPVMVASSGDPLLKKSAIAAYERALFPRAALVTPNLDELRMLDGTEGPQPRRDERGGRLSRGEIWLPILAQGRTSADKDGGRPSGDFTRRRRVCGAFCSRHQDARDRMHVFGGDSGQPRFGSFALGSRLRGEEIRDSGNREVAALGKNPRARAFPSL